MISLRRRSYRLILAVGIALLFLLSQHPAFLLAVRKNLLYGHNLFGPSLSEFEAHRLQANALLNGNHTIAIFEHEQFHEEVHGSVLWTFTQFTDIRVEIYRPPWRFGFDGVIKSWWPSQPLPKAQFWDDLERDSSIRWIFIPTIDYMKSNFEDISPRLQKAWEARQPQDRFTIIGLRHWGSRDMSKEIAWWAERDAISFLALGDHVSLAVRESLVWGSGEYFEGQPEAQEAITRVRVETYIPIFPPDYEDVDDLGNPLPGGSVAEGLNKALIQSSNFDTGHRAMAPLFDELRDDIVGG